MGQEKHNAHGAGRCYGSHGAGAVALTLEHARFLFANDFSNPPNLCGYHGFSYVR